MGIVSLTLHEVSPTKYFFSIEEKWRELKRGFSLRKGFIRFAHVGNKIKGAVPQSDLKAVTIVSQCWSIEV